MGGSSKNRISFFSGLILILNLIFILALLLSYLAYYISPDTIPMIAFAGLAYPIILVANIAFVLLWIFVKPKLALFSIVFILLGWNHIGRLVQFGSSSDSKEGTIKFKILSYNIQNFLKVNASNTKFITDFENQDRIVEFISNENADVIFIQELLYDREGYDRFAHLLGKKFNCPNVHYRNYFERKKEKVDAIAILSRFPLINKGHMEYDGKTICIYADMIQGQDTIRIYNVHLASIQFRQKDYDFISDITSKTEQQEIKESSMQIISKLKSAFVARGNQVNIIETHISASPYPVIICGDFNDTSSSYAYRILSTDRKDAFVESGSGLGITYAGDNFPAFRIDYILHDEVFQSSGFTRHKISLSDHYPISCILTR
ncbi:MAG: endonuclease/exonuclease/phosphatase family protein [Bacteroidales bacterium]